MDSYFIIKSSHINKKYDVIQLPHKLITRFGDSKYSDFTQHKDEERKQNYITRHKVNEDWTDLNKAGTWSRYILWNKKTIKTSIKDMEKRFNINITLLNT